MQKNGTCHAIVLAAGEGTRLRSLTADVDGRSVPKQFCSLRGGPTLLGEAHRRARASVGAGPIVTVVAREHERYWAAEFGAGAAEPIVQPANRGTAPGLLLPLLVVLERDPDARVAVLPSDHHVENEERLATELAFALAHAHDSPWSVTLLGITPDAPESEYGWILPDPGASRFGGVRRFVEKPSPAVAAELFAQGALWNGLLLVARAKALLDLYARRLPALALDFARVFALSKRLRARALEDLYGRIEPADFSRDVLAGSEDCLRVLAVPPCGWTDLGTPRRVAECLSRAPRRRAARARLTPPLVLAHQIAARSLGLGPSAAPVPLV